MSKRALSITLGIILSTGLLWLALREADLSGVASALTNLNLPILGLCGAALALSIYLRSVRWRLICNRSGEEHKLFFRATSLGYFANLVLPLRAGELVRTVALARLTSSRFSVVFASTVIDRLLDLTVAVIMAGFVYLHLPLFSLAEPLIIMAILLVAIVVVFVVYLKAPERIPSRYISPLRERLRKSGYRELWRETRMEIIRITSNRVGLTIGALLLIILAVDYLVIFFLIRSFDLLLPWMAPLTLWVFLSLGSALPSAPGYIGIYQLAAVWSLKNYSVDASTAVAVATILQLTLVVVATLCAGRGAWSLAAKALRQQRS